MRTLIALILSLATTAGAGTFNENYYASAWCDFHSGRSEVTMKSGARADCITADYAVEVDWTQKWAEAIGQSLHYASETGLPAAILLLVHERSKPAELYRLESTIAHFNLPITVFILDAPKEPQS